MYHGSFFKCPDKVLKCQDQHYLCRCLCRFTSQSDDIHMYIESIDTVLLITIIIAGIFRGGEGYTFHGG